MSDCSRTRYGYPFVDRQVNASAQSNFVVEGGLAVAEHNVLDLVDPMDNRIRTSTPKRQTSVRDLQSFSNNV